MKISYILQLKDLSLMLLFGSFMGILYGLMNIPKQIKNIIILQIISDIIFSILFTGLFILLVNIINLGEIRLFLIVSYILGFTIERITIGKLFAKGYKNVYTLIIKTLKSLYKSKLGRVIFK